MNRYEINGTLNVFDRHGEIIGLKIHTEVEEPSMESAKHQATQVLSEEADMNIAFYKDHGHELSLISVTIDSIIDRNNNESHYGQLPYHYCN